MRNTLHALPAVAQTAGRIPAYLFPIRYLALAVGLVCCLTNLSAAPVLMTFEGVNGAQAFGYNVGPYSGTMNGAPVDLFCVDFRNEVGVGEQWDANLTYITPGADLSDTRYGNLPDALTLYQEAAWLSQQYASEPASQYGDIQATIWRLFDTAGPAPGSSWWLQQASSHYAGGDYTNFRIVTNLPPVHAFGQVQEFLTVAQSNAIPEPGTHLLIGLGLVSLSCAWKYIRG